MAAIDLAGTEANKVVQVLKYLAIASFVIGTLQPKQAFYWLILVSAYLNLLKRFTVFDKNFTYIDLLVANTPPLACVAGICIGTTVGFATGRFEVRKVHVIATLIAGMLGAAAAAAKLLGGASSMGGGLNGAINAGAYIFLIPMAAIHYKSPADVAKLMRWACYVCVPVALYGVHQAFNGFTWWESLFEYGSEFSLTQYGLGEVRAFSTMNSAISLSSVMAICMAFCVYLIKSKRWNGVGFSIPLAVVLFIIFGAGLGATLRRSGILLVVAALVAVFAFRSRFRTTFFYSTAVAGLLSLYIFSGALLRWTWDNRSADGFFDSKYLSQMVQFNTWQDRLAGFNNMVTNPDLWKPFGVSREYIEATRQLEGQYTIALRTATDFSALRSESYTHDALSNAIVSYGYIPMAFAILVAIVALVSLHSRLFALPPKSPEYFNYLWLLALSAGVVASGITSSQALTIFPVNVFAYILFGVTLEAWIKAGDHRKRRSVPADPDVEIQVGQAQPAAV